MDLPATVRQYTLLCHEYSAVPNAGVLTALRFRLAALRPSGAFHDRDMLPLVDLLLGAPAAAHVRSLDFLQASRDGPEFGRCGFGSHGALALAALLRKGGAELGEEGKEGRLARIESLELSGNLIGPHGGVALAEALGGNVSLRVLGLRKCSVGERGGLALARTVLAPGSGSVLRRMDLSVNNLGVRALTACEDALAARRQQKPATDVMEVDLSGNLVFAEVMNSVTHGAGIILAIVGAVFMGMRAAQVGTWRHCWATTVYSTALIVLFVSSCMYHSLFACMCGHRVFHVLDHSAIYILIAGSYTPYLLIPFAHEPFYSVWLLGFMWACCAAGVLLTSFYSGRYKAQISLSLFIGMGWTAAICIQDLRIALLDGGVQWLFGGGVIYTLGVPLFLRNRELDHAIWHLFVLAGAASHWWGIYHYVMPLE